MNELVLHKEHLALGAKMGPFASFHMPLTYKGVKAEHLCVREHVGVFDVSHMGEFFVSGDKALDLIQHTTSNNVATLAVGDAQYGYIPNEAGGVIDDLLIYRISNDSYMLVVNASNKEKDWDWFNTHNKNFGAHLENVSNKYALLAVQGPKANALIQELSPINPNTRKGFSIVKTSVGGISNIWVATTGYTGAGGVELYIPAEKAVQVWHALLAAGEKHNIQPIGLAARDTLRLEMGYCLYGHELTDNISPIAARLGWCTYFEKSFVGKEFIRNDKTNGTEQLRVGFTMIDRGVPRQGYTLIDAEGNTIGIVTSGTSSPSLGVGIGMGYVNRAFAKSGTEIFVLIREKYVKAQITRLPFLV